MLVIDENMFRLARMQETLLKVSSSNRMENLNNYKKLVVQIDTKAFSDILDEIKHIDEHNQSLEDEVQFLQSIKSTYDQLLQLQSSFKRVCETYGNAELELSDLSSLDIEYIENRINAINGYLVNLKNIEVNKDKIQELNEELIDLEKNKIYLDNKLLEMESVLRNNFINAEGRFIVNGRLEYTSVVSEYRNLGYDFNELLNDNNLLEEKLDEYETKKNEVNESVRAAEICYNSILNEESKQVLNETKKELLMVMYQLTMLKILKLLTQDCVEYSEFINKRKHLIDLIKYRVSMMKQLGMNLSIDPFSRTKVNEQYETVLSLTDNSKAISDIRKEISELNSRTEEMLKQNNSYLISLNDTRTIIENKVGINDIDITSVELPVEEDVVKKEILQNQVIDVKFIPLTFNMNIVSQKTTSVIKRVNQMMNSSIQQKNEINEEVVPELVIVPKTVEETKNVDFTDSLVTIENDLNEEEDNKLDVVDDFKIIENEEIVKKEQALPIENNVTTSVNFDNIFETVNPFEEPSLFLEKSDDTLPDMPMIDETSKSVDSLTSEELKNISIKKEDEIEFQLGNSNEEMPEAFWVTQEDDDSDFVEEPSLSFDEQINVLLSSEDKSDSKVRKRVV